MANSAAIPEAAWQALEKASTGMVNDALALAGIQGSVVGIRPARGSLCANMDETLPPSEFRVEGGEELGNEYPT